MPDSLLFGAFKLFCITGYLFISTVLLYHQFIQRWLKFSAGFCMVYAVSSFLFFDFFPFSFGERLVTSVPYLLFFLSPFLIGLGLWKGLSIPQVAGGMLLYFLCSIIFLMIAHSTFESPFGISFRLSSLVRQWIEMGAMVILIAGSVGVFGYCNAMKLEGRETFGLLLIFFMVMMVVCTTIQFTIGFEYLGRSIRAGGLWFPGLNL